MLARPDVQNGRNADKTASDFSRFDVVLIIVLGVQNRVVALFGTTIQVFLSSSVRGLY